jgi:transcriptional regulator with XRE-family HTH domain
MQLSKRISLWREAAGLTRAELASLVGVTPAAIHQWECGLRKDGEIVPVTPSTRRIMAMASVFGISLERFWGEIPSDPQRAA